MYRADNERVSSQSPRFYMSCEYVAHASVALNCNIFDVSQIQAFSLRKPKIRENIPAISKLHIFTQISVLPA